MITWRATGEIAALRRDDAAAEIMVYKCKYRFCNKDVLVGFYDCSKQPRDGIKVQSEWRVDELVIYAVIKSKFPFMYWLLYCFLSSVRVHFVHALLLACVLGGKRYSLEREKACCSMRRRRRRS